MREYHNRYIIKRLDESLSKELLQKSLTGQPSSAPDPDKVSVTSGGHLVPADAGGEQKGNHMTEEKLTPKAQSEVLLRKMLRGKDVHKYFTEMMENNILISGQPISHWEEEFKIRIKTEDLNPQTCREMDLQVLKLNQEATFYYNVSIARAQMIKHGNEAVFMGKFQELVEEYKSKGKGRLPAKDTLENLVRAGQLDVESAQTIADIEVKFWKNILDHLGRCQSILKNSSLLISVELKHLSLEKSLDNIERKINY